MSKLALHIRQATEDDSELVATLGAQTFRDAFGVMNEPQSMKAYIHSSFSQKQIAAELVDPKSTFLLAFEADNAIGYAKLKSGAAPDCVRGVKPVELVRIYVTQNIIGKGYGSILMERCFEEAAKQGFETIWLGVWEHNTPALAFYKKWQFKIVGSHNFLLGNEAQNDLIMERAVHLQN